ncbi:MAG: T9SS type A sorting domain-containing protein [Flavobacteriales bacterium]|nr:T9SS type A sorting domain-containing protein [Flavobacteriales bacterium]
MIRSIPLFLAGSLLASLMQAQIPNGGFESWASMGAFQDPTDWVTMNALTFPLSGDLSCEQGTPGAVGASYVKITTRNVTGVGVMDGFIFSGDPTSGLDGFPWTTRPPALNGKWQYNTGTDQAMIFVTLSKWNPGIQDIDVVGTGVVQPMGVQASWTNFSIPITYFMVDDPDTARIVIWSSVGATVAGSTISVDDLSFGVSTGMAEATSGPDLNLYPSPAGNMLNVRSTQRLLEVTVLDMSGRAVRQVPMNDLLGTVDVSTLVPGVYVAQVRMADGRLSRRTFVKD